MKFGTWIFKKGDEGMDWIDLAQDTDRWWLLKCGSKPPGSIKCREFLD
jgi:hypothetical protein